MQNIFIQQKYKTIFVWKTRPPKKEIITAGVIKAQVGIRERDRTPTHWFRATLDAAKTP
jgi:hypothetical protein